jgi:ABC-type glycerol-3-phosphate transport system substrate-binding protein
MAKRLAALGAIAVALSMVLGACAPGPQESASDEPATLTYWTFLDPKQDNPRSVALKENLQAFEKANPTIKVNVEVVAYADMLARLPQAAATGTTPDVTMMFNVMLPQMADAGVFKPLDEYVGGAPKDDWVQPWDGTVFNGKKIALPYEHRVGVLIYNKKILQQVGMEAPATWDEVTTTARAATAAGYKGFGAGYGLIDNASYISEVFASYLAQTGQKITDDSGKAAFDSKATEGFFEFFHTLQAEGSLGGDVVGGSTSKVMDSMVAGQTAMTVIGNQQFKGALAKNPDLAWAPIPGVDDAHRKASILGWTIGMGESTKHPAQAWKFIEYMTSKEGETIVAKGGEAPARKSTLEDSYFAQPEQKLLLDFAKNIQETGVSTTYPKNWLTISNGVATACQKMYLEGLSPAEALKIAVDAANG